MNTNKSLVVVKHNAIINSYHSMTPLEQRFINGLIATHHSGEKIDADTVFEMSAYDIKKAFPSLDVNTIYEMLRDIIDRLYSRSIHVPITHENGNIEHVKMRWVWKIAYVKDQALVKLQFSPEIARFIDGFCGAGDFTKYRLEHTQGFKSGYAMRFYELFAESLSKNKKYTPGKPCYREFTIDDLRDRFQLKKKYKSIKDFKMYVIDYALREINGQSDIKVKVNYEKRGRTVYKAVFELKYRSKITDDSTKQSRGKTHTKPKTFDKTAYEKNADKELSEMLKGIGKL